MSRNTSSPFPYFIMTEEPIETMQIAEQKLGLQLDANAYNLWFAAEENSPSVVKAEEGVVKPINNKSLKSSPAEVKFRVSDPQNCVFQIVHPHEINLQPVAALKRGRPRKKKVKKDILEPVTVKEEFPKTEPKKVPKSGARTRSGRLVKLPKYIESDFKKIEITSDEQDLQVSDFRRFEEKENTKIQFMEWQIKKRSIRSQYRCPKCLKAYMGKNKMIQHLKKYPDHGPLPEGLQQFNFDVWNYLFDITQRCKSGQRGLKFCEELSNLLHNVQLLKSALFKTVTDNNKNCVQIDKVLGNAIGLPPGKYKFDENELYKDVTVLQLITNSEFFKPNNTPTATTTTATCNDEDGNNRTSDGDVLNEKHLISVDTNKIDESRIALERKIFKKDNTIENVNMLENVTASEKCTSGIADDLPELADCEMVHCIQNIKSENTFEKNSETSHSPPKKIDEESQISIHTDTDLLSENLLNLPSLPNTRTSDDELILSGVDNSSNLLDNSASSDEVMNVDQFVNERFKKIIEPDIELSNTSLNLDMPSLELFQFHTV